VHVWRAELSGIGDEVHSWLSPEERERAFRCARPLAGHLRAGARGVLRELLGRYLDADPSALAFRVDAHGRPVLAGAPEHVSFNVSHSGPIALLAFTATASVGVDVQVSPARPIDEIAIARRALSAETTARLAALEAAARPRAFVRAWTRHEATLKLHRAGLWTAGEPERRRACADSVWVTELDMGSEAAGAVALERSPRELRCWSWNMTGRASADARDGSAASSDGAACFCGGR
jgi:4'-phosphopantetheinyl transferase